MDPGIKAYRVRWQAVNDIERQELLDMTTETRWQQLNAIINLAFDLGIFVSKDDDFEWIVRWAKLKEEGSD